MEPAGVKENPFSSTAGFQRTLERYLLPHTEARKTVQRITLLACGTGQVHPEVRALIKLFPQVQIKGYDIAIVAGRFQGTYGSNVSFEQRDLRDGLENEPRADIVIARNLQVLGSSGRGNPLAFMSTRSDAQTILHTGIAHLQDGGILYASSFQEEPSVEKMDQLLAEEPIDLIVNHEQNREYSPLLPGLDHVIYIGRKKSV